MSNTNNDIDAHCIVVSDLIEIDLIFNQVLLKVVVLSINNFWL